MRPHTWSKPKPLVGVAGRTALDYLMDIFKTVPKTMEMEFIFVVGPNLGERQIPPFIEQHYPDVKAHYVVQDEIRGQSHALYLGREHLAGPMIMCFSDTLIETDLSFLDRETSDGVASVKAVSDPRRLRRGGGQWRGLGGALRSRSPRTWRTIWRSSVAIISAVRKT